MHNLYDSLSVVKTLEPNVVNNDTDGTGVAVDLAGYETAMMVFEVGASGDTLSGSVYLDLILQESADGSTGWAAPAAADVENNSVRIDDPAEDSVVVKVGYKGEKRYIRAFVDTTGTHTNGTPIGACVVLGRARHVGGIA